MIFPQSLLSLVSADIDISPGQLVGHIILDGLILLFSVPFLFLMWWFERRYLNTWQRILALKDECQLASSSVINPDLNLSLVHLSGETKTTSLVEYPIFNINEVNTIKLESQVEMYQWVRHERKRRNQFRRHYTYTEEWKSEHQITDCFDHANPEEWIINSIMIINPNVQLGAYTLSDGLKSSTVAKIPVQFTLDNQKYFMQNAHHWRYANVFESGGYLYLQQRTLLGVGDLRVRLFKEPCGTHSVVAQQVDKTFSPYNVREVSERLLAQESDGCCTAYQSDDLAIMQIDWIYEGDVSKDETFEIKIKALSDKAYYDRIYICCWMSLWLSFPIWAHPSIPEWIPILNSTSYQSFESWVLCLLVPLCVLAISLAWLCYRPLLGILIFLLAIVSCTGMGYGLIQI